MNKPPLTISFEAQIINGVTHIILPGRKWRAEFIENAIILHEVDDYLQSPNP